MSLRVSWKGRTFAALATLGCVVGSASAVEPNPEASSVAAPVVRSTGWQPSEQPGLHTWTNPRGEDFFALCVNASAKDLAAAKVQPRDVVVLFDTSASQVGEYRQQALAVLNELLPRLHADDRVALWALDVQAVPLTQDFVAADSDAMRAAVAKLTRRAPLGATNLPGGIQQAATKLAARPGDTRGSAVLYIGDGMSAADLFNQAGLKTLTADLARQQVPVHSYAVGPRKDLPLLGILAQRTGGVVLFEMVGSDSDDPRTVAGRLAATVAAPVVYPTAIAVSEDIEILPNTALPLRGDRATVYLGKGQLLDDATVSVTTATGQQSWQVGQMTEEAGDTFLSGLWNQSAEDGGLSNGLAGTPMLRVAQNGFNNQIAAMLASGREALQTRNADQAEQIALAVQHADPNNVEAKVLLAAAQRRKSQYVAFLQPADAPPVLPGNGAGADAPPALGGQPGPGIQNALSDVEREISIRTQKVTQQVELAISDAQRLAQVSPADAIAIVKRQENALRAINNIDPETRAELLRRLRSVGEQLANLGAAEQENAARRLRQEAAQNARERLLQLALEEDLELEQLIDRVRALMTEGRHGDPNSFERAEAVSRAAVELRPGNAPAALALFSAEAAGQLDKAFRLRSLRADRFLETLYQVELSHVPFPDEPPIRWPPAEVWRALTERRKKYASVDLKKNSPAEEKIQSALLDPRGVDIEFIDTPLKDAMDFLADAHDITIIIDQVALTDEGIASDEPLNQVLSGISLRSALKILLEPLGLTYVVEDEVMKITTITKADEKLSTRVYPVGDLVIPIVNPLAAGLGQGLGGGGGFGGQGGLGGGGQFGFGSAPFGGLGGGGGQQGGGAGGGVFNIPPMVLPQPAAQPAEEDQTSAIPVAGPFGNGFAQVQDTPPAGGFRFDNESVEALKKKRVTET